MKIEMTLYIDLTAQGDDPDAVGDEVAMAVEDFLRSAGWPDATVSVAYVDNAEEDNDG